MQSDSGLLRWLNVPFVYNAFSAAVGANALRRKLIENHVRAKPDDKVIEYRVRFGPSTSMASAEVQDIGLDINPDCIAFAKRTNGARALS